MQEESEAGPSTVDFIPSAGREEKGNSSGINRNPRAVA